VHFRELPNAIFLPPSLKSTDSIEENLKDTSVSMVRHRHPRRRRKHAGTKFLVVLLFAASAAITWQFARQPVSSSPYASLKPTPVGLNQPAPSGQDYAAFIAGRPSRPAYLYSVIPGGVASIEELRQAMEHDPVVAREFQGFDFQRAHLVQVSEKQAMQVAYRMGDKVYWTRKKVALHPGETLISDGKIVARTRCGNRIAMVALGPPAVVEPVEVDFNEPLFFNDMVTHDAEPKLDTYADALPEPANSLLPVSHGRKVPFFLLPFFGLPGGAAVSHTPLAVTPEPGTMLLLSSGLVGVYLKARKSRRKP
jgi:hypothetical protein